MQNNQPRNTQGFLNSVQGQQPQAPAAPAQGVEQGALSDGNPQSISNFMTALNKVGAGSNNTFMQTPNAPSSAPVQPLLSNAPRSNGNAGQSSMQDVSNGGQGQTSFQGVSNSQLSQQQGQSQQQQPYFMQSNYQPQQGSAIRPYMSGQGQAASQNGYQQLQAPNAQNSYVPLGGTSQSAPTFANLQTTTVPTTAQALASLNAASSSRNYLGLTVGPNGLQTGGGPVSTPYVNSSGQSTGVPIPKGIDPYTNSVATLAQSYQPAPAESAAQYIAQQQSAQPNAAFGTIGNTGPSAVYLNDTPPTPDSPFSQRNTGATNGVNTGSGNDAVSLLFSDENVKDDIQDGQGDTRSFLDTIGAHSYQYKDEKHGKGTFVSPMAQELEQTRLGKSAVIDTPEGKMVNYARLSGVMLSAQSMLNKRLDNLEKNFSKGNK